MSTSTVSIVEEIIQQGSQGSIQDALPASLPRPLPLPLLSFISFSSFFSPIFQAL